MPQNQPASTAANDPASQVAELVRKAKRTVVFTGAGMSAESGIPTFRGGDDSLWSAFNPMGLATEAAFREDPALVWGWYVWRMAKVQAAQPNAGHHAIAWMLQHLPGIELVTQNVDDLHERAGSDPVTHLHGSLFAHRCLACARPHLDFEIPQDALDQPQLRLQPPRCQHCGECIRPGVVWFHELLPEQTWQQAEQAMRRADLVLSVGTSGVVEPAASLVRLARTSRAQVVEINPAASGQSEFVDVAWRQTAALALPELVARLQADGGRT